jgi:hypothetical protein
VIKAPARTMRANGRGNRLCTRGGSYLRVPLTLSPPRHCLVDEPRRGFYTYPSPLLSARVVSAIGQLLCAIDPSSLRSTFPRAKGLCYRGICPAGESLAVGIFLKSFVVESDARVRYWECQLVSAFLFSVFFCRIFPSTCIAFPILRAESWRQLFLHRHLKMFLVTRSH